MKCDMVMKQFRRNSLGVLLRFVERRETTAVLLCQKNFIVDICSDIYISV